MLKEEFCGHCGTVFNPHLKKCARCGKVSYCNRTCQTIHWKIEHKRNCIAPKPISVPVIELRNQTPLDVTSIPNDIWINHIFKYLSNQDIFEGM